MQMWQPQSQAKRIIFVGIVSPQLTFSAVLILSKGDAAHGFYHSQRYRLFIIEDHPLGCLYGERQQRTVDIL